MFVGDADEFLNVRKGGGQLSDLLADAGDADTLPLTWRLFSNNGHVALTDGILREMTDAEPVALESGKPGRFVKSLFRPRAEVERLGIHGPVYAEGFTPTFASDWARKHPDADPMRPEADFGFETAQVNHYAVRSVEAFLLKRDRGRANHVNDTLGLEYWKRWCQGGEEDQSILRVMPAVDAAMEELLRDPVTRGLHEGALEWHRKRVNKLLQDPAVARLKVDILEQTGDLEPAAPPIAPAAPSAPPAAAAAMENELAIRAPKRHANRLAMLAKMPKDGVVAEIGVWNGAFSQAIMEVTSPKSLTLIDPWDLLAGQASDTWTHEKHEDASAMRSMYDSVVARNESNPAVDVRKGFSAEVLETFPDNHFDWVYIDGNHLYDFVRRDVEISFDKVRPGGCIAGDDFFWKRDGRMHVREAVFDVLREKGLSGIHERMGQQFMIWLPE